jgi:flagellar hook-basal body complex protein FliE
MAITTVNSAIQAYNNAAKSFGSGAVTDADSAVSTGAGGSNFASMLKEGVDSAISAGHKGEEMSKQAIAGKADVRDVVAAVNNAEMTLQTVVAVRDKVIGAYNDILKMPI